MARHTGVIKLSNGRFRARYFQGYDAKTGKRVYPARTFDTEREARDWRAGELAARGSSIVEGRGVTLSAYLDHWLSTKLDIRENSRHTYQTYIDVYIKPQLGNTKLTKLTPAQVEQWQTDLLKKISAQTVVHVRATLHQAIKSAQRKNLVRTNVIEATDGPKKSRSQRYPLKIEEALRIMIACERAEHGLSYQLMAHCGLRPEEAMGLAWADLELTSGARGSMRVTRVVHHRRSKEGFSFHRPKTVSSERTVMFSADLVARLLDHRKAQLQQKLRMGKLWLDHDLVFTNSVGEPLKRPFLAYRFDKMVKALGLSEEISMYTLRHFFVTSSLIAGVDFKTVSREAGHSNVAFTMNTYGSVLDEMHDTAAIKREQLLKSRSGK